MSEMENINQEALDAQQQFEAEQGSNTQSTNQNTAVQEQPKSTGKRPEGWRSDDGKFWKWQNYDNLPSEYKAFLPRESTKGKLNQNGIEPIVHQDPFDGRLYKYWISIFPNGGSTVSSMELSQQQQGGGYSGKSFYVDVGVGEHQVGEANALLAANESDRVYRYKYVNDYATETTSVRNADGTSTTTSKRGVMLLKQKRVGYGS
jgi:hypothetical protein